jgi:glycosyltransferase involved in cell wall biosynthesis
VTAAGARPGAAAPPVCSVIVPSYMEATRIRRCLRSLARQDLDEPFETIVVDSSPDETATIVAREFPEVALIHLPQRTDAPRARNLAVTRARADLLAFIDADCVAAPDWLRRLLALLRAGYDAAGGGIANGNGGTAVSWAGYVCEFREFFPEGAPRDVENLTINNSAYRRAAFEAVGGFPLDCFPQEDQVFHDAFRRAGLRIRYDPTIVVAHTHRADLGAFLHHQRTIGRANATVLRRIDRPGSAIARRRPVAVAGAPALVLLRFLRTMNACRGVTVARPALRPAVAWRCLLGQCWWAWGFVERAGRGVRDGAAVARR